MNAVLLAFPAGIAAADQAIKHFIRRWPAGSVIWKAEGIFEIVCSKNTGAAFSILSGRTGMIAMLSAVLLAGIVFFAFRCVRLTREAAIALVCLAGGGIGNLIDRLLFGFVTDYIRLTFIEFAVFNFADMVITCSAGFLLVLVLSDRLERSTGEEHGRYS